MLLHAETLNIDLNLAGCSTAQTLDRTVTFSQTMDNTSYLVALGNVGHNIGYNQLQQNTPQGATLRYISFGLSVKSKATTNLVLTYALSANACFNLVNANVAMITNTLVDAGIVYIDTSSTSKLALI